MGCRLSEMVICATPLHEGYPLSVQWRPMDDDDTNKTRWVIELALESGVTASVFLLRNPSVRNVHIAEIV
jgi:hypothetical protein